MSEARVSIIFDGDSAAAAAASERLAKAIDRLARAEKDEAASATAAAAAEKARSAAVNQAGSDTERWSARQQEAYQREISLRQRAESEMDREFSKRQKLASKIESDARQIGRDSNLISRGVAAAGSSVSGFGAAIVGLAGVAPALSPLLGLLAEFPIAVGAAAGAFGAFKLLGLNDVAKAASKVEAVQARMTQIRQQEAAGLITQKQATADLAKQQIALAAATSNLTGPQKQALALYQQWDEVIKGLGARVQQRLLPSVANLSTVLQANGGAIRSFFVNSAGAIANALDKFTAISQTPLFKQEFSAFLRESTGLLGGFLNEAIKLGGAFGGIAVAIEPAQQAIGAMIDHVTTLFANWTQGAGRADLAGFFAAMTVSLRTTGQLLGSVGQTLGRVFVDAYPASQRLLQGINQLFGGLNSWVGGHGAQIRGAFTGIADAMGGISNWIQAHGQEIGTILTSAFTIATNVAHGFVGVARLIGPVLSGVLAVLAPLSSAFASLSNSIGGLGTVGVVLGLVSAFTALRGALLGVKVGEEVITGWQAAGAALTGMLSPTTLILGALVGAGILWAGYARGIQSTGSAAAAAVGHLNDLANAIRGLRSAQAGAIGAEQAHRDAIWQSQAAHKAVTEAVRQRNQDEAVLVVNQERLRHLEQDGSSSASTLAAAQKRVAESMRAVSQDGERVTAAYHANSDAQANLKITANGLSNANHDVKKSQDAVSASASDQAKKFAEVIANAQRAATAFATATKPVGGYASAQEAAAIKTESARRSLAQYVDGLNHVQGAYAPVAAALRDYAIKINDIPDKSVTDLVLNEVLHGDSPAKIAADINAIHSKAVVLDITTQQTTYHHDVGGRTHGKTGGVVGGPADAGDTVPVYVTPGEVILNRAQQALIGPDKISAALGSATTTLMPGGHYKTGKKPPATPKTHHAALFHPGTPPKFPASVNPDSPLGHAISDVKAALSAIGAAQTKYDDDSQTYDLDARQADIEAPTLTIVQPDGTEIRDEKGIGTRVSQLSHLIDDKNTIIADLNDQAAKMRAAVQQMQDALAKLAAAIEATFKNIQKEHEEAARLTAASAQNRKDAQYNRDQAASREQDASAESHKAHPDRRKLATLRAQALAFRNTAHQQDEDATAQTAAARVHTQNAGRLETRLQALQQTQTDYNQRVGDLSATLNHEEPFTLRGLNLDVEDLQHQIAQVQATQGSGGPGVGGGGTPPPVAGGAFAANPEIAQSQLALLAGRNLAAAIGRAQLPILGSFRQGVLHVPADGVAYLHSGEQVIRPGVSGGSGGGGDSRSIVELHLKDTLGDFIDARVMKASDKLIVKTGEAADTRRREGRY